MAKSKKTKGLGKKIFAWLMLIGMLASVLTTVIVGLFS